MGMPRAKYHRRSLQVPVSTSHDNEIARRDRYDDILVSTRPTPVRGRLFPRIMPPAHDNSNADFMLQHQCQAIDKVIQPLADLCHSIASATKSTRMRAFWGDDSGRSEPSCHKADRPVR